MVGANIQEALLHQRHGRTGGLASGDEQVARLRQQGSRLALVARQSAGESCEQGRTGDQLRAGGIGQLRCTLAGQLGRRRCGVRISGLETDRAELDQRTHCRFADFLLHEQLRCLARALQRLRRESSFERRVREHAERFGGRVAITAASEESDEASQPGDANKLDGLAVRHRRSARSYTRRLDTRCYDGAMIAALRTSVDEARAGTNAEALAVALIDLAECEPIFGHRQAVVRGLLQEAATLVDKLGCAPLEGRILLRLAYVKLADGDLEGTEQLAGRARERLADDRYRAIEAGVLLARAAIRRHELDEAERALGEIAQDAEPDTTPVAARAGVVLAVAFAERALEQQDYALAHDHVRAVLDAVRTDETLDELAFTARQMMTLVELALGRPAQACAAMREIIPIAKRHEAFEDEIEARLGLAGALGERGDAIGLEEAEKHLQIARDRALERGLDSLHMASLVAQAGLLARTGRTRAALDRCIEIAQVAMTKQDLVRYGAAVALMAQIYEQKGDLASAYRTYAEAHASLRETIGDRAKDVIVPHMNEFADRIGRSKFAEIAERVNQASHAHSAFRDLSGKHHG